MKNSHYDWKNLLIELTKKEISVRYKKTFFGFLWMFLNPLSQMLILGIVFQNFANLSIKTENYFLFLFIGLIIWNFFSNTLYTTIPIYVNERALLQKSKFPREIILISVLFSNLFHYLVSLLVLLCFISIYFLFSNGMGVVLNLIIRTPLILLTTIWLGLLTTGIGLFLSSLNVKYRDINFFTSAALPLLFYASPIIWELHFVPKAILPILYLNPLASIIEINRYVFLNEGLAFSKGILLGLIVTIIVLALGIYIFEKESPYFDDWL
ncbi:MAG: sugar ABC transporter permease [Patescibacteria group bacterium]|nr:MAG: sugar ABC transporter permease [Patescibacteria group bacterium]